MSEDTNLMTLSVVGLDTFAREIQHEGKTHKVISVGIGDEFDRSARFRSLLRSLLCNDCIDIDVKYLNEIGLSREDASELGMHIEDLENINIPPRSEWDE